MLKIGITGGIGSGKTTVCRVFQSLSIPVFNADNVAKSLMATDITLIQGIKETFGDQAYFPNGELNRKFLSSIVFSDSNALEALNKLVHPATIRAFRSWSLVQDSKYCLHEAAILFESGAYKSCDYSVLVFAPEALRIQRVSSRDRLSEQEVRSRISKQMPEEEKKKLADFVIVNDGKTAIIPQVLDLHRRFSNL